MRVLFVHCSYQLKGGEDTVVEGEMDLLRNNGVEVELLSFNNEQHTTAKLLLLPFNVTACRKTRQRIKTFKPDVVHVHNLHFGASPSVLRAAKKEGVPAVMTLHNYRLLCPSGILFHKGALFLNSLRQSFPWKAVQQGVYKNSRLITLWMAVCMNLHRRMKLWNDCGRFIALTPHARSLFLQSPLGVPAEKVVVKPNFVAATGKPSFERENHFLYVGRLSEEKGIRILLDTFSICNEDFKIAGDGPLKDEVVRRCAQHPNIEYLGPLTKESVAEEMRRCTALLFPSVWYEGMPMTIIEALACGTPVIASRLGAMANMITHGHNGFLFEAGNREELMHQLKAWKNLTEEERQQASVAAWRSYRQSYTPEKNIGQLLSIYQSLLTGNAASLKHDNLLMVAAKDGVVSSSPLPNNP